MDTMVAEAAQDFEGGGEEQGVMRIGKRCYVSNLAWRTSWQDLKDAFRTVGTVVYANVTRGDDGELDGRAGGGRQHSPRPGPAAPICGVHTPTLCACAGRSKGWGIVEFETPEQVRRSGRPAIWGQQRAWG